MRSYYCLVGSPKGLNNVISVGRSGLHCTRVTKCVGGAKDARSLPAAIFTRENMDNLRRSMINKIYHYMAVYEEFIGIKQVREAHARVLMAEEKFVKAQESRRKAQEELMVMQNKLKIIREELERTPRGNEKYIELVTREWNLNREEEQFRKQFEQFEDRERETFNELSSALRFSHEKERAQNEKTKYWSVFGSVIGACLGIIGTSINSSLKIRQMKTVMTETSAETMAQVEGRLAALFSQLDKLAEIKPVATSASNSASSSDLENQVLTSIDSLSQKIGEFEQRLEQITLAGSSAPGEENSFKVSTGGNAADISQVEQLLKEQETKFTKVVAIGSVTILIGVPLISKFLFNF